MMQPYGQTGFTFPPELIQHLNSFANKKTQDDPATAGGQPQGIGQPPQQQVQSNPSDSFGQLQSLSKILGYDSGTLFGYGGNGSALSSLTNGSSQGGLLASLMGLLK